MRVFVTGGHGFVGRWLRAHLEECGDEVEAPDESVDVTDAERLLDAVSACRPDAVYHLAALTHVGESWSDPAEVFRVNALGTLNVLQACRKAGAAPVVLLVGTAEVYGAVGPEELPLSESSPLRPVTPYAASKVAAEYLGLQAHLGYGLPVVSVRAFNHVGPGQADAFAVSALARRVVEAERSGARSIPVGNLEARRDFTDVRDVVRAYRLLVDKGQPGCVYNVCSGRDVAIAEVAGRLLELAGAQLELRADPSLQRPVDVPVLRGDASRLASATGWRPQIALDDTLGDVLAHWRQELARPAASRLAASD